MQFPHTSVLLSECLEFFDGRSIKCFIDGTLGAAGHAEAILSAHPEIETFVGIDQDPVALEIAEKRLKKWADKVVLKRGNFCALEQMEVDQIDGMLLDLGVSSMQLDLPEKGFSFSQEGPLDMRMDPTSPLTAEEVVNTWSEQELGRIFRNYGEEKRWRAAARAVVKAREQKPIRTTRDLAEVLQSCLAKRKNINPLTLVFQGLRICVNKELQVLEDVIPVAIDKLRSGGRLAVISFHSLEDRIVKNKFRYAASDKELTSGIGGLFLDKEPQVRILTRKPVCPSEKEVARNPRSRSAKLRVIEKR